MEGSGLSGTGFIDKSGQPGDFSGGGFFMKNTFGRCLGDHFLRRFKFRGDFVGFILFDRGFQSFGNGFDRCFSGFIA